MSEHGSHATHEIIPLSGQDLRRLLQPMAVIEALREAYVGLAGNRADQGRSLGFKIEGGSIHVKSGLLPGTHLAFASKVNVRKLGRMSDVELVIFDASGSGLQDVATAWAAYRQASRSDIGLRFNLSGYGSPD